MTSASASAPVLRPALQAIGALTWKRAAVAAALALLLAVLLNPVFLIPFWVLLGRLVFIAALLLIAFAAAGTWHPRRIPRWLAHVLAVVITAPIATLLAYLPSIDGNLANMLRPARISGFIYITATVLVVAPLLALGALYRERDAQARAAQLGLALEKNTLEKEALDTRLKLLQAQIEPHFLFNIVANVQALVESGSPQAAPVLKSLLDYLRAAMPRLHAGASTLANEIALARSYLELMQMRMRDRAAQGSQAAACRPTAEVALRRVPGPGFANPHPR